ncbi:MAG: hypothetical protein EU536_03125 [Promethearchaeota archaeon]|nr:MAG: hypothetical protein EU536_03125 [Candidatus Lokiarchaeota archaeon]
MVSVEVRDCHNCGQFHLRNISFFAYWLQCPKCNTYYCPRCSGYHNPRTSQFAFLAYLLISLIFYLGVILILGPIVPSSGGTVDFVGSYTMAGLIFFPAFIVLNLIIWSVIRKLKKQNAITSIACPTCQTQMRLLYHDFFLYFWLFFIHVLYITTILNETGIFFYRIFEAGPPVFTLTINFLFILSGVLIFIIWFFKRTGKYFLPGYKTNTRVWLGEVFSVFFFISVTLIILIALPTDDHVFLFDLFYHFSTITFWFFPVFIIGSLLYRGLQKIALNVRRGPIFQVLIAILYIIFPFFIWGGISISFGLYQPYVNFNMITLTLYSGIVNELIPYLCLGVVFGVAVAIRIKKTINHPHNVTKVSRKSILVLLILVISAGFLIVEHLFNLTTTNLLLKSLSSLSLRIIFIILFSGIIFCLIYELYSNWLSSSSHLGKILEKKLGSLLYPILLGSLFVCLSFSMIIIVPLLTDTSLFPNYFLLIDPSLLRIGFLCGFFAAFIITKYSVSLD